MTQDLRIRPAAPSDLDALLALHQEVQALHATALPALFRRDSPAAAARAAFQRSLDDPAALWFVADDGSPRGYLFASLHEVPETWVQPAFRLCEINHLVVQTKSRRRGLARRLVSTLRDVARQRGFDRIGLEVWRFNLEARQAFAQLGFQPLSERLELPRRP
jgi:ribosomal protein S18 acetylase RimI-like enzyme